jgi:hypothetical protein
VAKAAEALVREKGTDEKGNLYELVVWRVPVTVVIRRACVIALRSFGLVRRSRLCFTIIITRRAITDTFAARRRHTVLLTLTASSRTSSPT